MKNKNTKSHLVETSIEFGQMAMKRIAREREEMHEYAKFLETNSLKYRVAKKMIELHGSTLFGKALDKAAINCYCEIGKFSKRYMLQDHDYDNVSDAIGAYHEIK